MDLPSDIILWVLVIIYKKIDDDFHFLVVENAKTGNISFVSGAQEMEDGDDLSNTAKREIHEELDIDTTDFVFTPTEFSHVFIFWPKKVERAGKKGEYHVFLLDVTDIADTISHTAELKNIRWITHEEVVQSLTFPEVKEIFEKLTFSN